MLPEKLSKQDLTTCVEWLESIEAQYPGPLPKQIYVKPQTYGYLWSFALLHRREAGKVRVMNNKLYWRSVPLGMLEGPEEHPGEPVVTQMAVSDVHQGTRPQVKKFLFESVVRHGPHYATRTGVDLLLTQDDCDKMLAILALGSFGPGITISLAEAP